MSSQSTRADFLAGDFSSESAVRGVFIRRRRRAPGSSANDVDGVHARSPAAGADHSAPAAGPRRLRRWSVAELVARAVAAPPTERMVHH